MEVNYFFLAQAVGKRGNLPIYDGQAIGLFDLFPADRRWPLKGKLPYLLNLRRSRRDGQETSTLSFTLRDDDGKPIGLPQNWKQNVAIPPGHRFFTCYGVIELEFPKAADYHLTIGTDEPGGVAMYTYSMQITEAPK